MTQFSIRWQKDFLSNWISLNDFPFYLSPNNPPYLGVYVIWHGGACPRVVRVGQGDLFDRLSAHKNDPQITQYKQYGPLYATWAMLHQSYLNGVENFLGRHYSPLVGDRFPNVQPIAVNLPV
jgi:hypothetical protein